MNIFHCSLTILLLLAIPAQSAAIQPCIQVKNGTYCGVYDPSFNQDVFLGIPYAQPPTGPNRLKQAQSLNSTWTGNKSVTEYGYDCPQYPSVLFSITTLNISEDCLTLNIIKPSNSGKDLPVAVWIHGGGFSSGVVSDYNLSYFVNASTTIQKPIIAISIHYRLGYWGFLAGNALAAENNTNLGLFDQRLALRWIRENIHYFGGDPDKVTLFGDGAISISDQMMAFGGHNGNLFRAAIIESGPPTTGQYPLYDTATSNASNAAYESVIAKAGCNKTSDTLGCLRSLNFSAIYAAFEVPETAPLYTFHPTIDGLFFEESPATQLLKGKFRRIPTIQGHNDDEGSLLSLGANSSSDAYTLAYMQVEWPYLNNADDQTILTLYPNIPSDGVPYGEFANSTFAANGTQWRRLASITGDIIIISGTRLFSHIASFNHSLPVYRYRANLTYPTIPAQFGSTHGIEIPYVFNSPVLKGTDATALTAEVMSRAWISFIVHLDPNYHGVADIPKWKVYSSIPDGENFVIGVGNFSTEADTYRAEGINFINSAIVGEG